VLGALARSGHLGGVSPQTVVLGRRGSIGGWLFSEPIIELHESELNDGLARLNRAPNP
jgi:hypothetical protein